MNAESGVPGALSGERRANQSGHPRRYGVISADGHLEVPPERWVPFVPTKWRDRTPRLVQLPEGGEGWVVEGQPLLHNGLNLTGRGRVRYRGASYRRPDGSPTEGTGPPRQRLAEQDEDGIDAEVLFPPIFASRFIESIGDKDAYRAMVSAYNRFLAEEYCAVAPDRLIGCAAIPVSGLDHALGELEAVAGMGIRCVALRQFPNGSPFARPEDDAFWERSLELGVRICPHQTMGAASPPIPVDAAATPCDRVVEGRPFSYVLSSRLGNEAPVYSIAQLIMAGVFDRFPSLQVYFAEANAGWLPMALYMFDDNYALFRELFGVRLDRRPSEYIASHIYVGIVRDPVAIRLRDHLPLERIMWGSDFPHSVGSFPRSREFLDEGFAGVDPALRRQVLLETPAAFFGRDLDRAITETGP